MTRKKLTKHKKSDKLRKKENKMDKVKVKKAAVKTAKVTAGGVVLSAGVCLKLTDMGLSVSEVIFSGAKNLTNEFAQAPDLKIGESILISMQKQSGKYASKLIARGKGTY